LISFKKEDWYRITATINNRGVAVEVIIYNFVFNKIYIPQPLQIFDIAAQSGNSLPFL